MPTAPTLGLMALAALAFAVFPGPAVLYIVTRSADQGRRAGLVSVGAVACGSLVHVAFAAFGLSRLLMASALAFSAVRYAGAGYLVYLGIRRLRGRGRHRPQAPSPPPAPLRRVFLEGAAVSVLNPKTALFFVAVLPQFVDLGRGRVALQLLVLGAVLVGVTLASDSAYALTAARLGGWLRRRGARFGRLQ